MKVMTRSNERACFAWLTWLLAYPYIPYNSCCQFPYFPYRCSGAKRRGKQLPLPRHKEVMGKNMGRIGRGSRSGVMKGQGPTFANGRQIWATRPAVALGQAV